MTPTALFTVTGLANGDSEPTALPVKPTLATAATASSAQGRYDHHLRRQPLGQLHGLARTARSPSRSGRSR